MGREITNLLMRWGDGDKSCLDELLPLVYGELRTLARRQLRGQGNKLSLQPTMLLHEAYLKLVGINQPKLEDRSRFYAMAATVMRNVLVDHVRQRIAAKRGGGQFKISISDAEPYHEPDLDLLALDHALKEFSQSYPQHGRIVELRYFGGLNVDETAAALEISPATVHRHWNFAKAWLRHKLDGSPEPMSTGKKPD